MSLLTNEQEQRGTSFNYYSSQIFPSQITNEELSSRSIYPEPTSSVADASAAAGQKKLQYETLTPEEEKYCPSLKWANNLIDVLGIKDKIFTSQCDRV